MSGLELKYGLYSLWFIEFADDVCSGGRCWERFTLQVK